MRNPPRSCDLHGGFFAPSGLPKPLPLGEVAPKVTERASPARKSRRRSDGQVLCQSDTIAVSGIRRQHPCPLSRAYARQLPQRGSHWHVGQALLRTTSQSASQTAPLVGEPLAKPFTLRGLPKPPLGRGGGTASAVTERLSSAAAYGQALLRTTSQSRRKLLDSSPSRGASGETVHFAGPAKASPSGGGVAAGDGEGYREFVENARQKREEFVKVIKMRRRY